MAVREFHGIIQNLWDEPLVWSRDDLDGGQWQEPFLPSKVPGAGRIENSNEGEWRSENGGFLGGILTGTSGWARWAARVVDPSETPSEHFEWIQVNWNLPFVGEPQIGMGVTRNDPAASDPFSTRDERPPTLEIVTTTVNGNDIPQDTVTQVAAYFFTLPLSFLVHLIPSISELSANFIVRRRAGTQASPPLFQTQSTASSGPSVLWHNSSSGESQIWFMDGHKINGRATVMAEDGKTPILIGAPWGIVGVADFNNNGGGDILWHNSSSNETQIWFMDGRRISSRATVMAENGDAIFVGLPWSIVGAGDFNRSGEAAILLHNSSSNETQIAFTGDFGSKISSRATVTAEDGKTPIFVGPPWSIVGVGDFNNDGRTDIVWHNSSSNETQIWFMDGPKISGRATVMAEDGKTPALVGLPFSIVGVGDFNNNGRADIVWHNSSSNETQIWIMDGRRISRRATAMAEGGKTPIFVGPPWSIVGANQFQATPPH